MVDVLSVLGSVGQCEESEEWAKLSWGPRSFKGQVTDNQIPGSWSENSNNVIGTRNGEMS